MANHSKQMFYQKILGQAVIDAFKKLEPISMMKNPVMFICEIGALITTIDCLVRRDPSTFSFALQISIWLWFTVLFANFAEAVAEGKGKAQANALRKTRRETIAHVMKNGKMEDILAHDLKKGDIFVVSAGEIIPADAVVIEGIASVDESAITGESAPVIREAGGDFNSLTGGTKVLSDRLVAKVVANPGETYLDRIIKLVENASRQKSPNEIALTIVLAALTVAFLAVVLALKFFGLYTGVSFWITILISLLVCLIPTTIGGLLSAIGISGIDRMIQANVIAISGKAVEAAGDVDVLILDKTGTITLGNRQAASFIPSSGVDVGALADAAQLASLADETPEGRSIVILAKEKYGLRERDMKSLEASFIPFTAQTRMSGVNVKDREIRKGAVEQIKKFVESHGGKFPSDIASIVESVAKQGATPLVVAEGAKVLGVIELKDIIKGGIKERIAQMRNMGIRTIMITGDNPLTAASVAAEAGVDDYLAEAKPEEKLELIRKEQAAGHLVAMTGDGTNDAPALAQADVAVAMNTGTQEAKEAGNLVDLDSNPTKLLEIVKIGKQMLITRGALTTFSIANDVAKYFAIIPAMLIGAFPSIEPLNIMYLSSSKSAILSAVIFNALIIIALIPLALRGVRFRPQSSMLLLQRNLLIYGIGGIIAPFIGIKIIDMLINALRII